ncbi:MAG: peptidase C25 [Candidatus Thermoplasmatota archaeon]|nr:peptidase C25 [Candidatus Thermoplasmatota archaeon]
MKNIALVVVVGMLLSSALAAAGTLTTHKTPAATVSASLTTPLLKEPTITTDGYLLLELDTTDTYLSTAGCPRLPMLVHTFELPFAATDISVSLTPSDFSTQQLTAQVKPAAPLLPLTPEYESLSSWGVTMKDEQVYAQTTPYPATWYTTTTGVGLNKDHQHVTFVSVHYYPVRYTPATATLMVAHHADITVTYTPPASTPFPATSTYELVIIAPQKFEAALQPLITHKNDMGVTTFLKTTEDIYAEYDGFDKPEEIKLFIKDAVETLGITSVMLFGGLKSQIYAKPRDDPNQGSKGWYVPVRYTNLFDNPKFPLEAESTLFDPGVISDLYYADIYEVGGSFSSWDPNGDGIYAAWNKPGVENDSALDLIPDVALGRLACTSLREVRTVVDKIITYETTTYGSDWFKKMTVISGDGFLDQEDLNIQWDTTGLPTGEYTIHAQSNNPSSDYGPIETINVTVDKTQETNLTFNHDDHLRINEYPGLPIAEICTVSEGNILGNTDFTYVPNDGEAYCNEFYFWANMSYLDEVLTIRGKSYDPVPYGHLTDIHVWITDSTDTVIFEDWRNDTEMYYEGEYVTGEEALLGRGGALYYMPPEFERDIIWASNGKFTGQEDVIDAWNQGAGFLFFSGHGSPNVWADHYPGVPGNRGYGSVHGISVTTLRPWPPYFERPVFPMDTIRNGEKLPIVVVGGCHNSQFNVSMVSGFLDGMLYLFPNFPKLHMWCYGQPVPETFSWRMIRNPKGGAIASIGNTGLGYGMPGIDLTTGGGDGWVSIEIFRQYGDYGIDSLGLAHQQTLTAYINTFDMTDMEAGHVKSVQQWALLGDPTLKIGGYA